MKRLFINRKIVNDVLYTKLTKPAADGTSSDKNIEEALASFKNLSSVIPHLQSAIKYCLPSYAQLR
jgi:hypothetical protein